MVRKCLWCAKMSSLILLFFAVLFFLFGYNIDTIINSMEFIMEETDITIYNSSTRHALLPLYPYPYKFLINQQDKCQHRKPFLLLLVVGQSNDAATRNAIRKTWGNEANYGDVIIMKMFLLGISPNATEVSQQFLEKESAVYGDIIQQDFQDTYYNLSLKTLMGMEWVTKFCPNASYVMKIDSDMFLNVEYLVQHLLLPELPVRKNYFTGYILANSRPIRDRSSKWYVPKHIYPNYTYPPYCAGPGYVFSVDMAQKIYEVAQVIRVIPMEDAFIGIGLHELHIKPTKPPAGIFNGHRIDYNLCAFKNLVTVHHYGKDELLEVWLNFWSKRTFKCKKWEGEI
ncbi:beta-1,3-galactosyltransferase 2-like [Discoglossus pictus]